MSEITQSKRELVEKLQKADWVLAPGVGTREESGMTITAVRDLLSAYDEQKRLAERLAGELEAANELNGHHFAKQAMRKMEEATTLMKVQQERAQAAEKLAEERGREIERLKAQVLPSICGMTPRQISETLARSEAKVAELERSDKLNRSVAAKQTIALAETQNKLAAERSAHEQTRQRDVRTTLKLAAVEAREAKLREALIAEMHFRQHWHPAFDPALTDAALAETGPAPEPGRCCACGWPIERHRTDGECPDEYGHVRAFKPIPEPADEKGGGE